MKSPRHRTIAKAGRVSICTSTIATAALVLAQAGWFASPASATIIGTPFGTQAPSGILSDSTGLTMNGGGQLLLDSGNSYTGATTINDGSVSLTAATALGTDTSTIAIAGLPLNGVIFDGTSGAGGGNLTAGGDITVARNISIRGAGSTGATGALTSVGNNTFSGAISTGSGTNTRIVSTQGKMTISSTALSIAAGTTLQIGGNGNVLLSGNIGATTGALQRSIGNGVLEITGTNNYTGITTNSSGFMRVSDQTNLGGSTAANAITIQAGALEIRTDAGSFATKGVSFTGNATMFLDHLVGSTAQNYTVAFKTLTQNINTTTTLNGRDGYGATFTQFTSTGAGTSTLTNNLNGLLTIGPAGTGANFWNQGDTAAARTLLIQGNGDTTINGAVIAPGGTVAHSITKTGTGTLTIQVGTASPVSNYTGLTNIQAGTLAINSIAALNNAATGSAAQINIGSGTSTATLSFIGAGAAADYTVAKIVNLNGITGGAVISANQTSANPVILNAISNSDTGTSAKTLTLSGTSLVDNVINGVITNSTGTGVTGVTKTGATNWVLTGANTYTGPTSISGGFLKVQDTFAGASRNVLADTTRVGFVNTGGFSGGTFQYVGAAAAASTENVGVVGQLAGAGTIRVTAGAGGTANLTVAFVDNAQAAAAASTASTTVTVGSTAGLYPGMKMLGGSAAAQISSITDATNIVVSAAQTIAAAAPLTFTRPNGGATVNYDPGVGATVSVASVPAVGILNGSSYFQGADFAYAPTAGSAFLRAPVYGTDATFVTAVGSLTAANHNLVTASTSSAAVSVLSLKINGATTPTVTSTGLLTINAGAAGTTGGILVTGGTATMDGAGGVSTGGAADLIVRVNGAADVLNLNTPVTATTTGGLTKNGAGTLILGATNAQTGTTTIQEGTLRLSGTATLSAANTAFIMAQGATLDLNGVSTGTRISSFNGDGTVANTAATAATLTVGNGGGNGGGTFTGVINETAGQISVVKQGNAGQTWSGVNTYTGATTINSTALVSVPVLANIGTASGIGKGVATNDATNAASLVFAGTSGGINYIGATSAKTDRLFTFNGSAAASGGQVINSSANSSSLIFSNPGAIVFGAGATVAQTLTLGGSSTGDSVFNPLIGDNGGLRTNLTKIGVGLWILGNSANSYTGTTAITAGTLRAISGTSLPAASNVVLSGSGILESSGALAATVGTAAGNVAWAANSPGGFSGGDAKLTVTLGGGPLVWGTTPNFLGGGALVLSSATALSEVEIASAFDISAGAATAGLSATTTVGGTLVTLTGASTTAGLTAGQVISGNANIPAGATIASIQGNTQFTLNTPATAAGTSVATNVAAGGFRPIIVNDNGNTASDIATISGAIGGASGDLAKQGNGILQLFGANTYAGNTLVQAGTLNVKTLGNSAGAAGSSNVGATGVGAGAVQLLGGTLDYVGAGETSSRAIQAATVSGSTNPTTNTIRSNGTGALILTNVVNGADPAGRVIGMNGENLGPNEIQTVLADNGGPLRLLKGDGGVWVSGLQHTFTGGVNVVGGTLGISGDPTPGVGAPTSGPLGTGTLTFGGGNIMAVGGDRHVTNSVTLAFTSGVQGDNSIFIDGAFATANTSTINNFIAAGKTLTLTGPVQSDATTNIRSLTFGGSGESIITGVVADGGTALSLGVNATGGGLLRLQGSAPNTYGGVTTLTAGTLSLEKAGAIPNGLGNVIALAGGTLQASSDAFGVIPNAVVNLTGNSTVAGSSSIEFQGTLTNSGGSRTLTNNIVAGKQLIVSGTTNLSEGPPARTLTYAGTGQTQVTGLIENSAGGGTIAGALTKTGTGTLSITGTANTYSGVTNVTGGILNVASLAAGGVPSSIGQAAVAGTNLVLNGGTLQYTGATPQTTNKLFSVGTAGATIDSSGTGSLSFTGTAVLTPGVSATPRNLTLTGTNGTAAAPNVLASQLVAGTVGTSEISLTKAGTGTWSLTNANTFTGGTTISAGILAANNTVGSATGTGPVNLAGGDLGGSGTVSGSIVGSAAGGNVAPGNSIGILNATSVNLSAGGGFSLEINSNTLASDKLNLSGALTLAAGSPLTIADLNTGAGNVVLTKFQFISYGGAQTGLFSIGGNVIRDIDTNPGDTFTVGGFTYGIDYNDGNNVSLRALAVPEPGTIGSLIAGCGLLLGLRRRRKAWSLLKNHD